MFNQTREDTEDASCKNAIDTSYKKLLSIDSIQECRKQDCHCVSPSKQEITRFSKIIKHIGRCL